MRFAFLVAPALLIGCSGGTPSDTTAAGCSESDKITLFADNDKDGYGAPDTQKEVCPPLDADGNPSGEVPRGFATNDDDCDDFRAEVNPSGIEICDGIDNDCDTQADEGLQFSFYRDADGDGYGAPDADEAQTSCAPSPGYVDNNQDCDDENAAIHPTATEVCDNGTDNDCNGHEDDGDPTLDITTASNWYRDVDGDSYGGLAEVQVRCGAPASDWVLNSQDCNDNDADISPSAVEICNKIDDDCDTFIDDSDPDIDPASQTTWNADEDADGFGDPDVTEQACFQPWFFTDNGDDCNDHEPLLTVPAGWLQDKDLDGYGAGTVSADSCTPPDADWVLLAKGRDCDDTNLFISPAGNEVCDSIDNDCDTLVDDDDPSLDPAFSTPFYRDVDKDGYGDAADTVLGCSAPPGYVDDDTDCQDGSATIHPKANEVCDGVDNDCDSKIDDQDPNVDLGSASTWYLDYDQDGFGDPSVPLVKCSQPLKYVGNDFDCDDTDDTKLVDGPYVHDLDGDGVGAGTQSSPSCGPPSPPNPDWVPTYYGIDCDNTDPTRYPGNLEICNNGVDEDCDGTDPPC